MTLEYNFHSIFRTVLTEPHLKLPMNNGSKESSCSPLQLEELELEIPFDICYRKASNLIEALGIELKNLVIKDETSIEVVPLNAPTTSVGDLILAVEDLLYGSHPPSMPHRFEERRRTIFEKFHQTNLSTAAQHTFVRTAILATDLLYTEDDGFLRSMEPIFLDLLAMELTFLRDGVHAEYPDLRALKQPHRWTKEDWKKRIDHPLYRNVVEYFDAAMYTKDEEKKIALEQKSLFFLAATEFDPFQHNPDWSEYNRHCAFYLAHHTGSGIARNQLLLLCKLFLMKSTEDPTKYSRKEKEQICSRSVATIAKILRDLPKAPKHPELFLRLLYLVCCKNADTTLYWYQPHTPLPSRLIDSTQHTYDQGLTTLVSKFFYDYLNGEYSAILKETKIDSRAVATLLATILAETAKLPEQDFLTWYNEQLALSGPLDTVEQKKDFFETAIKAFNIEVNFYQKKWLLHFLTTPDEQQYFHCDNGTTIPLPAKERTLLPILYSYVAQSTLIDREKLLIDGTTTPEQVKEKLLFFHKYLKTAIAQYFQKSPYSFSIYTLLTALSVYQKTHSTLLYTISYDTEVTVSDSRQHITKKNPCQTDYSFLPPDLNMDWFVPLFTRQEPFSQLTIPSHICPAMLQAIFPPRYLQMVLPTNTLRHILWNAERWYAEENQFIKHITLLSPTPEMLEELSSFFPGIETLTIEGECTEETLQHLKNCINIKDLTLKGLV